MCGWAQAFQYAYYAVMAYTAYETIQTGRQEGALADYQAEQTEADARAEVGMAQLEAMRIRKAGQRQLAEANAAMAGSGIDTGEGSALNINREITQGAEEDAYLTIVAGNDRSARMGQDAYATRISGDMAERSALIQGGGSLISLGNSMSKGWNTTSKTSGPRKQGSYIGTGPG